MKYVWNPCDFDPIDFLPPRLHRQSDAARALVHLIEYRRLDKRYKAHEGVTLQAKYLRNVVGVEHCEAIRDCLAEKGVITVKRSYTVGMSSFEFKIGPLFETSRFQRFQVTDRFLIRRMVKHLGQSRPDRRNTIHSQLFKWLGELIIEAERARDYVSKLGGNPDWVRQKRLTIDMLAEGDLWFTSDRFRRIHTNFTNLWSGLRQFLSLRGEPLVELDIANSQPLFFGLLSMVKWQFANQVSQQGAPALADYQSTSVTVETNNSINFPQPLPIPSLYDAGMHTVNSRTELPEDLDKYLGLVERGDFYEHLMGKAEPSWTDRNQFKNSFFQHVFYAKSAYPNHLAKVFRQEFPTAHRILTEIKANDPREAPRKMQELEADFVIGTCCRKLLTDHPAVPILTLHDGIWTTPNCIGLVRKIVETEFAELGVRPLLRCRTVNGVDLALGVSVQT